MNSMKFVKMFVFLRKMSVLKINSLLSLTHHAGIILVSRYQSTHLSYYFTTTLFKHQQSVSVFKGCIYMYKYRNTRRGEDTLNTGTGTRTTDYRKVTARRSPKKTPRFGAVPPKRKKNDKGVRDEQRLKRRRASKAQ